MINKEHEPKGVWNSSIKVPDTFEFVVLNYFSPYGRIILPRGDRFLSEGRSALSNPSLPGSAFFA